MEQGSVWKGNFNDEAVDEIFSWNKLDEIIFLQRVGCDRLRISREGQSLVHGKDLFSLVKKNDGKYEEFLLIDVLHEVLEDGATVIVEAVSEASVVLNGLTENILSHHCAMSSINAYMSFGNQSGFGVHYDDQDLIVVQIDGQKKWDFFHCEKIDNASESLLARPNEKDASMRIDLERGDVLYVPKGVWHHARPVGVPSLHLAIGLEYPSVADFLHWVIRENRKSAIFDNIRPYNLVAEKVSSDVMSFIHGACCPRAVQKFIANYYSRMRGVRIRPDMLNRFSVSGKDVFSRVPFVLLRCGVNEVSGLVDVNALGRNFKLSVDEIYLLDKMGEKGNMNYCDAMNALPNDWDKSEKEKILSGLLKHGLMTKLHPCEK